MDNELSYYPKEDFLKHEFDFQLSSPNIYCHNASEWSIINFRNIFISIFPTIDPDFPVCEWDHLLPQDKITINLLHNDRFNPKHSSYACIFVRCIFNKNPIAPPGTIFVVTDKLNQITSWGDHRTLFCYVGPDLDHYRISKWYIPYTGVIRVTETFQYIPNNPPLPKNHH